MKILNRRLALDDAHAADRRARRNGGEASAPHLTVNHCTAGSSAAGAIARFRNPAARVFAHRVIARDDAVTVAFHKNDPPGIPPSGGHADRPEQIEATVALAKHGPWWRADVMGEVGGVTDVGGGCRSRHLAPLGP